MLFRPNMEKLARQIELSIAQNDGVALFCPGRRGFPKIKPADLDRIDDFIDEAIMGIPWLSNGKIILLVYGTNAAALWNVFIKAAISIVEPDDDLEAFRPVAVGLRETIQQAEGIVLPPLPF